MFSVTMRDSFVVDATFRREDVDADGLVVDIGAAADVLPAVLGTLAYRTLDDEPELAGRNTTTEVLARVVADRLAERIRDGALGPGADALAGLAVTLQESRVAWASYDRPL